MKIGKKILIINKDINTVENDLILLTTNSKNDAIQNKVFFGVVNNKTFLFHHKEKEEVSWRLPVPELFGKLFDNNGNTLIQIDIHIKFSSDLNKFSVIFLSFFSILGFISSILTMLTNNLLRHRIPLSFFLLFFPIFSISLYFILLICMFQDLNIYKEGYFNNRINNMKKPNGT